MNPIAVLTSLAGKALTALHVPAKAQVVIIHVAVVFFTAFAAQLAFPVIIRAVGAGTLNWSALAALVTAAAGAGASAVGHYLTGLIPAEPPPAK